MSDYVMIDYKLTPKFIPFHTALGLTSRNVQGVNQFSTDVYP